MHIFDWAVVLLATGFIAYFFGAFGQFVERYWQGQGSQAYVYYRVLYQRYWGFLCLGFMPACLLFLGAGVWPLDYGLAKPPTHYDWLWIAGSALIIVPLSWQNARKPDNLAMYPQIRLYIWTWSVILHNALSWAAYLLAYEWLFRGFFLQAAARYLPVQTAIGLTTAIYALVHIPKGAKETIGAIPLGVLLGYLSLQTQTIWIAWLVHLTLALSNSYFSLYFHPEMHLKR